MALTTVSSDRLSTNVKNTNFTAAEKQDLTDDILPLAGQLGNRNLIINGAMQVAQRGTSSTSSSYQTVDRFGISAGGQDNAMTQAQADVTSGGAYDSGFRKCLKITNANQTGGAGAADFYRIFQFTEAQNVAQSGWNYTSSSSFVTLSFWVKSSVAQNFYGYLRTQDGTQQNFPFETGSLTADTWTKITKTIPGNSNITIDNDNGHGPCLFIDLFNGTDYTGSVTLNQWGAYNASVRVPDYGSANDDWYLTNSATFEITGVQLEVGEVVTDFEHRAFGQELHLCHRYYHKTTSTNWFNLIEKGSTYRRLRYEFPNIMRVVPTVSNASGTNNGSSGTPTGTQHASTKKITFHWDSPGLVELASGCEFSAEL